MRRLHWLLLLLVLLPAAVIAGPVVYYGSLTVPATGTVTFNQLHPSSCLGLNGSNILTDSAACLASIAAGNDIVITGASSAPTIAVTNAPSFTGTITDSASTFLEASTSGAATLQADGSGLINGFTLYEPNLTSTGNPFTVTTSLGTVFQLGGHGGVFIGGTAKVPPATYETWETQSTAGYCANFTALDLSTTETVSTIHPAAYGLKCNTTEIAAFDTSGNLGIAGAFYGSGAGLSSGTVPIAALTADTISGVALGGTLFALSFGTHLQGTDTSYTGAATKTISTDATNANAASTIVARDSSGNFAAGTVTVGSLIDSALTLSNCVGSDASKQLVSNTNCVLSVSGSGNMSVSAGPTPNVTITAAPSFTSVNPSGTAPLTIASPGAEPAGLDMAEGSTPTPSTPCPQASLASNVCFYLNDGTVMESNIRAGHTTLEFTRGAHFDGTNWIADTTGSASCYIGTSTNVFDCFSNSGLTVGNSFTQTSVFAVDSSGNITSAGLGSSATITCTNSSHVLTTSGCGGTVTSGTWTCTTSSATNCTTTKTVSSGSNCLVSMTTNPVITAGTFVFVSYASVSTTTLTITARNVFSGTGSNTASGIYMCNP